MTSSSFHRYCVADVEAEDFDLGEAYPGDLAFDVDVGVIDDPDALDSNDEDGLNEELGLEDDGFDGKTTSLYKICDLLLTFSSYACGSSILSASERKTDARF